MKDRKEDKINGTPPSPYPHAGMANPIEPAGRIELNNLTSTLLSKLLSLKNVPGRSKLNRKAEKINALEGIVSNEELIEFKSSGRIASHPTNSTDDSKLIAKPGLGIRLNENVAGIDVHKNILAVAIANQSGIVRERSFNNHLEHINDLIAQLAYYKVKYVGMESTAEYWQKLTWKLSDQGFEVLVANPQQTKTTQGKKTDKLDAKRIALALRDGRLKPSVVSRPDQFTRRKLNRDAIKKAEQGSASINRMKTMFAMYDAEEWIETLYSSQRGRRILFRSLESKETEEIEAILTEEYASGRGGITNQGILHRRAIQLMNFFMRMDIDAGNRIRFTQHLTDYVSCANVAEKFYLEIIKYSYENPQFKKNIELLISVPGIGVRSALSILVEITDINYFTGSKKLVKWTGLAPRVNQSGHRKRHSGHIYKGGNKWLRKVLYQSASIDYGHLKNGTEGHPVGSFIKRLVKNEKKLPKVAITAGARKLATYVFHILKKQLPFEEIFDLQDSEWHEKAKKRKMASLKKKLRRSKVVEILPILVSELSQRSIKLNQTETALAKELSNLLGVRTNPYIDPPWT